MQHGLREQVRYMGVQGGIELAEGLLDAIHPDVGLVLLGSLAKAIASAALVMAVLFVAYDAKIGMTVI